VSRSDVPVNGETQKTRVGAFFRRLTLHLVWFTRYKKWLRRAVDSLVMIISGP
jgi:hypothetical protein